MRLLEGVKADATISPDGQYRYALTRDWFGGSGRGSVMWIMLNPSTADAEEDDPTLRKVQKFSQAWGYDSLIVGNLFGLRSPTPMVLRKHPDPIGDANDWALESLFTAEGVGLVVAAWGAYSHMRNRDAAVIAMAGRAGRTLHALKLTKNGKPWHPLYVPDDTQPVVFRECAENAMNMPVSVLHDRGFVSITDRRFLNPAAPGPEQREQPQNETGVES